MIINWIRSLPDSFTFRRCLATVETKFLQVRTKSKRRTSGHRRKIEKSSDQERRRLKTKVSWRTEMTWPSPSAASRPDSAASHPDSDASLPDSAASHPDSWFKILTLPKTSGTMSDSLQPLGSGQSRLREKLKRLKRKSDGQVISVTLAAESQVNEPEMLEKVSSERVSSERVSSEKVSSEADASSREKRDICQSSDEKIRIRTRIGIDSVEDLLSLNTTRERESKKQAREIMELLEKPTVKEKSLIERFKSAGGSVQEFCVHGTKEDCSKLSPDGSGVCDKLHFAKIIQKHTDESLGDCSFLNTCFHMNSCKYVHYRVDSSSAHRLNRSSDSSSAHRPSRSGDSSSLRSSVHKLSRSGDSGSSAGKSPLLDVAKSSSESSRSFEQEEAILYPPQYIQSDLRFFDVSILGKFAVVMADPPWDIHMELPYGTMSDDEMRQLNIPCLQDDGLIFLWVTGRAMELGRECLKLWGYERCDELIWVKTNQLQRIIRTGRTGHWLNHGKEHCLVGIKGDPKNINRGLDCDVIVAEVRATSHKPDEIYGIIERLSPGTRKIELFGRHHNVQPNWITLGNQLDGVRLIDPVLIENFRKRYPDGDCMKKPDWKIPWWRLYEDGDYMKMEIIWRWRLYEDGDCMKMETVWRNRIEIKRKSKKKIN